MAAGPDGFREPSPYQFAGVGIPLRHFRFSRSAGIDQFFHHAFLLSQACAAAAPRDYAAAARWQ